MFSEYNISLPLGGASSDPCLNDPCIDDPCVSDPCLSDPHEWQLTCIRGVRKHYHRPFMVTLMAMMQPGARYLSVHAKEINYWWPTTIIHHKPITHELVIPTVDGGLPSTPRQLRVCLSFVCKTRSHINTKPGTVRRFRFLYQLFLNVKEGSFRF